MAHAAAIFLGAFLLFQIQPLIGKYILPWFGGTPAVWSTCMLFFQLLLLAGYAYSHGLATRVRPRLQGLVHLCFLALSVGLLIWLSVQWATPITPGAEWMPADCDAPVLDILCILAVGVGFPYFMVSTTGPLVQAWFANSYPGRSPYRLYTLSNIGSLFALVSYPFLFEPALSLRRQARAWSLAYLAFAAIMGWLAVMVWRADDRRTVSTPIPDQQPETGDRPTFGSVAMWVALPTSASIMLLATTNQICQEVAVIPFLWVLPLTIYLLSFIITFAGDRWYSRTFWAIALAVSTIGACVTLFDSLSVSVPIQVAVFSVTLLAGCMVCHGETVRLKPHPRHLTAFYLAISVGGACGGAFVTLAAPALFKGYWEYHLSLWLTWALFLVVLLRIKADWRTGTGLRALRAVMAGAVGLLGAVLVYETHQHYGDAVASSRNFYGVLRVREVSGINSEEKAYKLNHGAIIHGLQYHKDPWKRWSTTYYCEDSGVGLVMKHFRSTGPEGKGLEVGVVGLGAGTMAAYGEENDRFTFYEINPDVVRYAHGDEALFTYLGDTTAELSMVLGDARVSMTREAAGETVPSYDVLVLDAFSSDSIPVHLLTVEAVELYLQLLKHDGVLAIHISNRHLDLKPVVWALARHLDLAATVCKGEGDKERGCYRTTWMLLSRTDLTSFPVFEGKLTDDGNDSPEVLWTDDYSNIFSVLD